MKKGKKSIQIFQTSSYKLKMKNRRNSLKTNNFKGIHAAQNGDRYEIGSLEMENRWRHQVKKHVERRDTTWEGTQEWKLLSHS